MVRTRSQVALRFGTIAVAVLASLAACDDDGPSGPTFLRRNVLLTLGFGDEREIWDMAEDGTRMRRLTDNAVEDINPRWSADRQRIVFTRAREPIDPRRSRRFDIYIMTADGYDAHRVADTPSLDTLPTFSPDGSRIAFVGRDLSSTANYPRVFVMGTDGSNRQVLSPLGLFVRTSAEWSPDGGRLLFGARRVGESGQMELHVMDADGTNVRTIPDPCPMDFRLGRWSRDGSRISIMCSNLGEVPLYTITSSGTDFRRLTPPKPEFGSVDDHGGMWSDAGEFLLVMRSEVGTTIPLYKLDAMTGAPTLVARIAAPTFGLADWWSPFPPD